MMKKIIILLSVMLSSYANATQFKLNCGAFGNDPKNRSFVLEVSGTNVKLTFNVTQKKFTGSMNNTRSNSTVTVFSISPFQENGSVGIPKNLNKSKIEARYYSGSNFGAWYTATCNKL